VIVPFLEKGLVQQTGWLNEREFLVAVAMGMMSPGPVVITPPSWLPRRGILGSPGRDDRHLPAVVPAGPHRGADPAAPSREPERPGIHQRRLRAAIGTILGASVLLGRIAIGDWLTVLVALLSVVVLFRWKVGNPLLIAAAAVIGWSPIRCSRPPGSS